MDKLKTIVSDAVAELDDSFSGEQTKHVAKVIEDAVIRGLLEGQHRAVDACNDYPDGEKGTVEKIAAAIRRKNDTLIVNLSSLR